MGLKNLFIEPPSPDTNEPPPTKGKKVAVPLSSYEEWIDKAEKSLMEMDKSGAYYCTICKADISECCCVPENVHKIRAEILEDEDFH